MQYTATDVWRANTRCNVPLPTGKVLPTHLESACQTAITLMDCLDGFTLSPTLLDLHVVTRNTPQFFMGNFERKAFMHYKVGAP